MRISPERIFGVRNFRDSAGIDSDDQNYIESVVDPATLTKALTARGSSTWFMEEEVFPKTQFRPERNNTKRRGQREHARRLRHAPVTIYEAGQEH